MSKQWGHGRWTGRWEGLIAGLLIMFAVWMIVEYKKLKANEALLIQR